MEPIPVLLITGPVGVGKTTVAFEVSGKLDRRQVPHALVDMDSLRSSYPSPQGDPFNEALGLRNLAAVWRNYWAAGAKRLVMVDIVETRDELADYVHAIPGAAMSVVRLRAASATLRSRVQQREVGMGKEWHLQRSVELAALMEQANVEDFVVENDGRQVSEVASEILLRCGWLSEDLGHPTI